MSHSPEVHYEFIRIAVGYCLLGVFVVTALACLLSFIHVRQSGQTRPRPLIVIAPPWLRKSLYSSLIVQVVAASVVFWKGLLAVDTNQAAEHVEATMRRVGVDEFSEDIKSIGILKYWRHSNDFLPHIREAMGKASTEIWISGASFYLSVPENEDVLVDRAKHGVRIHYLFLDPYGNSLAAVAKTFSQTPDELRQECLTTIRGLQRIRERLPAADRANLEVRLFDESPRARFYIFDPADPNSNTFFVPHVNSVNSPALPGFLLSNVPYGLAQVYIASVKDFWNSAQPLSQWEIRHEKEMATALSVPSTQ